MQKLIVLLLLPFISCAQGHQNKQLDKEKVINKKVDTFMVAWRKPWIELEKAINDLPDSATAGRIAAYQQHPFFKAYTGFIEENGKHYIAARTRLFEQYAAPPQALLQLSWQKPEWPLAEQENTNLTLLSLAFLRSFDPSAIAQTAYNIASPSLMSSHNLGIADAQKLYGIRELYGTHIYTKKLSDTVWQCWTADHLWAVSFDFNLRRGMLSNIRHTQPGDPKYAAMQWPGSMVKPVNETNRLLADLRMLLWESYPSATTYDSLPYNYQRQLSHKLVHDFNNRQHSRYRVVRKQSLEQLDHNAPDLSAYKEQTTPADNILRDEDTSFWASYYFDHEQLDFSIGNAAALYFQAGEKEIIRRVQYNIFFPASYHARKLNASEWEVWALKDTDAVSYIWNINTGHVQQPRYWVKIVPH
ncbi:hypothetical protein [Filimonas effusa]|uniref:Uncharacterized protein n=1 Tax=Filimonas effusa TaxID=2508721 RepID=A0A4Q1D7F8_9BACT|nr:hypothetical protein [Filimonas effusa]RXK83627.1 hypothetical protein ESB13_16215 [Filimonas effusa]